MCNTRTRTIVLLAVVALAMSLIVALPIVVGAATSTETITIGSGEIPAYYVPLNTYYNYSFTQQIYTADEIGVTGDSVTIDAISFKYINAVEQIKENQTIYLLNTTKSEFESDFDWIPLSEFTEVFSGTVTYNDSEPWVTIDITPFVYTGGNIAVAYVNGDGDYTTENENTFSAHETTVSRVLAWRSDQGLLDLADLSTFHGGTYGRTVRSDIQFEMTVTNHIAPSITSPNKLSVVAGTGGSLALAATGDTPITWSLAGAPAGVTISGSTLNVAASVPAGTYIFTITADNGVEPDATQQFTLTVTAAGGNEGNGGNGGDDGSMLPATGDAVSLIAPAVLAVSSMLGILASSEWKKRR